MANDIPLGTPAYLTDFQNGQGLGFSSYFTYAADEDTNFLLLRTTLNQLNAEISAIQGPNAIAALDAFLWNDPANPITTPDQTYGVIGAASYEVTVNAGLLDIQKGAAYIGANRVATTSGIVGATSSGVAGTRWVSIDTNGAQFIEALAGQHALDIATVQWDGAAFTGAATYLADVFFDGDAWAWMQNRPAAGTTFPAQVFRRVADRIVEIEQTLSAAAGGGSVIALPPGTFAAPGVIFSDGAGAADTGTGFFRQAANVWAFAASGVEKLRLNAQGLAASINGASGTPWLHRSSNVNTGVYFPSADRVSLSGGGAESVRGASIGEGGAAFPTLLRVQATKAAAQNLASSSVPVALNFDTENFDVGGFHDNVTSNDQFVVPSNGGGSYRAVLNVTFVESTSSSPNTGDREVRISIGGTEVESVRLPAAGAGDTKVSVPVDVDLVATNIIRGEAAQNSGGAMDVTARVSLFRAA